MPASDIVIKGAREHNLRDISLTLPRNKLICLTGVSGSGKSSLAFDTLFAEGQRRYVESLSSFARQFLGQMPKPDVDLISGLSPSISISQKSSGKNPRSTVGTITEIYDYLRVLFARVGQGHCPKCDREITAQTREQIIARILLLPAGTKFAVLAPLIRGQKGEYRDLFEDLLKQGFVRARVDGETVSLTDNLRLDRQMRHDIEVVVDRLSVKKDARTRLAEAVELALKMGEGNLIVAVESAEGGDGKQAQKRGPRGGDLIFSAAYACTYCGISFEPPSPQLFSFNSPQGMCPECDGLGELYTFDPELLIPDQQKSFQEGAIELVGPWQELGRWRRHIYQGVAETMERKRDLPAGVLLTTAWGELDAGLQDVLLWGTGDEHITFTWRSGSAPMKYGGKYSGVIPELLEKHRTAKSRPLINKLEQCMRTIRCPDCGGQRLKAQARAVRVTTSSPQFEQRPALSLPEVCGLAVADAVEFFSGLILDETRSLIADEVVKEIRGRLGFLMNVGLDYLALDRTAPTLSGGESQRIRLAGQVGAGLVGVLYILDEPSIGLHPRDNNRLLHTLCRLRDLGNTVVVVEHDEDTMRAADHIIDFGPGPGVKGGKVVAEGPAAKVVKSRQSVTGQYLAGKLAIDVPARRRAAIPAPSSAEHRNEQNEKVLRIAGARHNNLKNIDVDIPLGCFVCVTGVSGSGKSSLVNDILVEALRRDLNGGNGEPGLHDRIEGLEHLDKLIAIDQSPIGRTPRSNPGTYIKVFDEIRALFAQLPDAKRRGYAPGRFSFNVSGGRCEACEGNGSNKLEMDFLADVWVTCPVCEGHRYNRETLQVRFKGHTIAEVLEMDVQQALEVFENIPKVRHRLQTLHDVGLDYLKIGQPSPTLSGGEAQRIKLARELVKKSTGKTLYLLDEPTTGLHFADIKMLLKVLHDFVEAGNTVLVVEHNQDVVKTADWVIDLGPEGGAGGGEILAVGTPEEIAACERSHTGKALIPVLGGNGAPRAARARSRALPSGDGETARYGERRFDPASRISVQGARQHNLKGIDIEIARDKMTVFCGPSGSGKSSLAMDTIYAEGQRRYVESLSSYARQFVSQMQKPALEHIDGLSPAIAIEQKNLGHSPRSTVGTVTEIYDYLRILMARLGTPHCPDCEIPIGTQTADDVVDKIMAAEDGTRLLLLAPVEVEVGRDYASVWEELRKTGYVRVRIDGETHSLDSPPEIDRRRKHAVEVVCDRIAVKGEDRSRIAESVENALALGRGIIHVAEAQENAPEQQWPVVIHSQHLACQQCGRSFDPLTPHNFSFNSSLGWCPQCEGLGVQVGANPSALIRDGKRSLADGAIELWPDLAAPIAREMLASLCQATGVSLDVPFEQLPAKMRRVILHGAGEEWFEVDSTGSRPVRRRVHEKGAREVNPPGPEGHATGVRFRFQYKGLYPALEEASRLSPAFRGRLEQFVGEVECSACDGSRLRDDAGASRLRNKTIDDLCRLPLAELKSAIDRWKLSSRDRKIAGEVLREIKARVQFLCDVGLEYLTLARGAATLSGGEAQRIRLASQLGSGLCGVLYVLDEPTIGLHPRDNGRLLKALHKLRDLGNTLLVVEHDRDVIAQCDFLADFGPGAGRHGGRIVAEGTPKQVERRRKSVTGPYLSGKKAIPVPTNRRVTCSSTGPRPVAPHGPGGHATGVLDWPTLEIVDARHNNLKSIDVSIPLGALTAVTGVSGGGKSSLIEDILYKALARRLHRAATVPGPHEAIRGVEQINKVIRVDQQPLGNSPTSNPATYTGAFELIRQLFSQLPDAKVRGYSARRFSFNVSGGRCEDCEGNGQKCIEMHFLPDVWVECETCRGRRYNEETLGVKFRGHSISDVLHMSCGEAVTLFSNIPKIRRILNTLCDVGLDYVTLGQPAPTLSGGEAQRVKLAAELSRPDTGRTLYLLDEPTTGLHFDDLAKLLDVLHRLVDLGNTVVVIEHNLDVIKQADWVIDLGPEAGEAGGRLVAAGTPEEIAEHAARAAKIEGGPLLRCHTGEALAPVLAAGPHVRRTAYQPEDDGKRNGELDITEVGRDAKMPWEADGRRWHTRDRVGRQGEPVRWDGRILERVVDRIHELGDFSDTDWNSRGVVEIAAQKKSDGWFFHAITGETWLLKMKFRTKKNAFRRDELQDRLPLKSLNEMEDLPIYGNEPRVKVKNHRGPLQEIEVRVHSFREIDRPEFWQFLEQSAAGFAQFTKKASENPAELMPWKKLGRRWHLMRKGFLSGRKVYWESDVLEDLFDLLEEASPGGEFLWGNKVLVHRMLAGKSDPWATVGTKKRDAVHLHLSGAKGAFALGRFTHIGRAPELDATPPDKDIIRLKFRTPEEVHAAPLLEFLQEHAAAAAR